MKILVKGAIAKIIDGGKYLRTVGRILRVKNTKYHQQKRFDPNAKEWVTFLDHYEGTFPAGLTPLVEKELRKRGVDCHVSYRVPGIDVKVDPDCLNGKTLRKYQIPAVSLSLKKLRGIVAGCTGMGKTLVGSAIIHYLLKAKMYPILVIVPSKHLLHQTSKVIENLLSLKVGRIGDGFKDFKHHPIVVAIPNTLRQALPEPKWSASQMKMVEGDPPSPQMQRFIKSCKSLIIDEAHHVQEEQGKNSVGMWIKLAMMCPADCRLGLTGTPDKNGKVPLRQLQSATGPIIYRLESNELIEQGMLAKPTIFFVTDEEVFGRHVDSMEEKTDKKPNFRMPRPWGNKQVRPWHKIYSEVIVNNTTYNENVMRVAKRSLQLGRPPLIFVQQVKHLMSLKRMSNRVGVELRILHAKDSVAKRNEIIEEMLRTKSFCVASTPLFDEGVDIPALDSLIFAGGGKALGKLIQRVGRGLRRKDDDNTVWVTDFSHSNNNITLKHALDRVSEMQVQKWKVKNVYDISKIFRRNK